MIAKTSQTVLITGASSGIGFELAKRFARDGHRLILVARDGVKLQAKAREIALLGSMPVETIAADLTDRQAPVFITERLQQKNITVDILVNNAGVGLYGEFKETSLSHELEMIALNIASLTALTKLLLPGMLARKSGKILNVASTAAFQPGPLMAVYFATKAYVLSFSEAIGEELSGSGVTVTALCPGPTRTNFDTTAGADKSKLFANPGIADAATVAEQGYQGLMRGKRIIIVGAKNKFLIFMLRFTPRFIVPKIVKRLQGN